MPAPPHIVWILCDQLRADALGFAGNRIVRTPTLDRLAGLGTVFENLFVQYPTCMASRSCMLTGRYPIANRMANGSAFLDPREVTLAETLQRAGWRTGLFGKLHLTPQLYTARELGSDRPVIDAARFMPPAGLGAIAADPAKRHYGFQEHAGFEDALWGEYIDWLAARLPGEAAALRRGHGPLALDSPWPGEFLADVGVRQVPAELHPSAFIVDRASDFFARHHAQAPCFLQVSFVDPHHPWDPPRDIAETYDADAIPLPRYHDTGDIAWPPTVRDRFTQCRPIPREQVADAKVRRTIACYYAMIETLDRALGRLVARIEAAGELPNTIFLFASDHGEFNGDYGLWRKPTMHYDVLTRSPAFIAWPGHLPGGRRWDGLAQQIDFAPTVLDLLGLPLTPGIQGESRAPMLRGEADPGRDWVFTQSHWAASGGPYCNCLTLRSRDAKINYYPDDRVAHCFDLAADPDERHDFAPEDPGRANDLLRRLLSATYETIDPLPLPLSQY